MYSIVAILFAIRIYSNPVHCLLKYISCVVLKVKSQPPTDMLFDFTKCTDGKRKYGNVEINDSFVST